MIKIDPDWLRSHPLPESQTPTDKNERGRVLVIGGSTFVPGALRLTGEAALRAGAGKLQMGTVGEVALNLGLIVPEAGLLALPSDGAGELDVQGVDAVIEQACACDALVLGPGMRGSASCTEFVGRIVAALPPSVAVVLDAAAIAAARGCRDAIRSHVGPMILTPHHGEMAALTGTSKEHISRHGEQVAREVAEDLNAIIVLKAAETLIASPKADCLIHDGGTPGLATGGSGDVLAGILGGLLSRRAEPMAAAGWAVWTHGQAGSQLTERLGGPGLLGRELIDLIPEILNSASRRGLAGVRKS